MRLRRSSTTDRPGLVRTARIDRHVDQVVSRANPGDIAVIDVIDLDRGTAEQLVAAGVSAVVNAAATCSGRFPVHGAQTLLEAGVVLVDDVGGEVFSRVRDGDLVRLDGADLYAAGDRAASGAVQSDETVAELDAIARDGLNARITTLVADAGRLLTADSSHVLEGDRFPSMITRFRDRVVVVIAAGAEPDELRTARALARERRALVVGVGAGADLARSAGLTPRLIVLGRHAVARNGVDGAREVLVLDGADLDTRVPPGVPRVNASSLGSAEDTAVLLAHQRDAALVVTFGVDESIGGVLDRAAVAGSAPIVTRLRGGGRNVAGVALAPLAGRGRRGWRGFAAVLIALAVLAAAAVAGVAYERNRASDAADDATDAAVVTARAEAAEAEAFQSTVAPALTAGRLAGHSVALVVLPGATGVAPMASALRSSGAAVTGPVVLTKRYVDPTRALALRDLAVAVASPGIRRAIQAQPPSTPAANQLDQVVASTLAVKSVASVGGTDTDVATLLTGLDRLGALSAPATGVRPSDLVVVLAPASGSSEAVARGTALAQGLSRGGRATVVVRSAPATAGDAASDGIVRVFRTGERGGPVSTVDDGASVTGRLSTVLALDALLRGAPGNAYGTAADARAALPTPVIGTAPQR